mmetsp:Transcript_22673/g.54563  ORF Transcript_22673/g.54563 Transcript_22673/m.54563 type:complete len:207 (+) Transcript_22673:1851-2471(+)
MFTLNSRLASASTSAMLTSPFTCLRAMVRRYTSTSARFLASSARSSRGLNFSKAFVICGSSRDVTKRRSHSGSDDSWLAITSSSGFCPSFGISSSASMRTTRVLRDSNCFSGVAKSFSNTTFGSTDASASSNPAASLRTSASYPSSVWHSIADRLRSRLVGVDCSLLSCRQKCHAATRSLSNSRASNSALITDFPTPPPPLSQKSF